MQLDVHDGTKNVAKAILHFRQQGLLHRIIRELRCVDGGKVELLYNQETGCKKLSCSFTVAAAYGSDRKIENWHFLTHSHYGPGNIEYTSHGQS